MDPWLVDNLRCPRDQQSLATKGDYSLVCPSGHSYPIHDGVPIMLLEEKPDTEPVFAETLKHAAEGTYTDPRKNNPLTLGEVDHIAQRLVAGSCGLMYRSLVNNLKRYPIPRLRLKASKGARILDIGCAWGRWSLAAAGMGYRAVGIDPSIYNVLAARRIAIQLGHTENVYLVADGRYLPFAKDCFDAVFSYSCLQHMGEEDVRLVLREIRRTLNRGGISMIEMPNKAGLRNLYVQALRGFRKPTYTDVRYWRPKELASLYGECIGPTRLEIDGFFTINPQVSDLDMLPLPYKVVVLVSEALRHAGRIVPGLTSVADSLYVISTKV
jgi:ubiquinone/menaquinone biosynthesis C-methylase UbiE/uncharacterized protein YbaR (Trm112 family)